MKTTYRRAMAVLFFDAVALVVFYSLIPRLKRPLDVMMVLFVLLSIITMVAIRARWLRNILTVVLSLSILVFLLGMSQKTFDFMSLFEKGKMVGLAEGDHWRENEPQSYIDARKKAATKYPPETLELKFAGDVFTDSDRDALVVENISGVGRETAHVGLKPMRIKGQPLGYELTPDNRVRHYSRIPDGAMLFDGLSVINSYGYRNTSGDEKADSAYIFLGCSFMFGFGLNDDETVPYYFSEANDFASAIANLGVSGYGPHQSLRDLELDYHLSRTAIRSDAVKGIFFTFIDDHQRRIADPVLLDAPYFMLENGTLVYKGLYGDNLHVASRHPRLSMLVTRSRILSALVQKLVLTRGSEEVARRWETAFALFGSMDKLCRDRYGVGVTFLYWDNDLEVVSKARAHGLDVVFIDDILGPGWRLEAVKYYSFDGHPSAYANKLVGRYLFDRVKQNTN